MEKLRLKNGTEFEMMPTGTNFTSNTKEFRFKSRLPIEVVKEQLLAVKEVYYIENSGTCTCHMDIVKLVSLSENIQDNIYAAVFSTDLTAQLFKELKAEIELLKNGGNTEETTLPPVYEPEDDTEEETENEEIETNPEDIPDEEPRIDEPTENNEPTEPETPTEEPTE